MQKNYNRIPDDIKASVLSAIEVSGCNIVTIAKAHNISKGTIYKWIRDKSSCITQGTPQIPDRESLQKTTSEGKCPQNNINFLELPILDSENLTNTISANSTSSSSHSSKLSKASLIFNDLSIILEGKVSSSGLIAIIQILEKSL